MRNLTRMVLVMGFCAQSVLGLSGCAHSKLQNSVGDRAEQTSDPAQQKRLRELLSDDESITQNIQQIPLEVGGVRLKTTQFDIPIVINSQVEKWIDYFTGRGRKYFEVYLRRSVFFIPFITPILKQNEMPHDLVYLAMIESGFNNHARSHAKAVGPWQFITATGRRYGLKVNWWVDERRDVRKSTVAAIEYLRNLYQLFNSWELAAASYNAGEAKIARAIRRFGTRDFWSLARQRFLKPETRDYVPKMMAAAILAKNREQFGFESESRMIELAVADLNTSANPVGVDRQTDSKHLQSVLKDFEKDPVTGSARPATPLKSTVVVDDTGEAPGSMLPETLPESAPEVADNAQAEAEEESATEEAPNLSDASEMLAVSMPHVSKKGDFGGEEVAEFEIESPADLFKISRAAGISYDVVKALNPEILRWCTPPNSGMYRIKLPVSVKERFLVTYNHPAFPREIRFKTHKARSGESLPGIARRFGIGVEPLKDLNSGPGGQALRSGKVVLLPIPSDSSRSFTALDLVDPPRRRKLRRHRKSSRTYRVNLQDRTARPKRADAKSPAQTLSENL